MNVLVTGCAGFVGSNVSRLLMEAGHAVEGIDSLTDTYSVRLKQWRLDDLSSRSGFSFQRLDISDFDSLRAIFRDRAGHRGISAVINLGAWAGVRASVANPWVYYDTNMLGTLNLLELCREFGVGKFILASTSSVYGTGMTGPVTEDAPSNQTLSPYAASKKAAETLLYSYHHLYGIDATVLRYFTVYGPAGRPDMSIFRFIRGIAEDEPIAVYGDGSQQRDFTYVTDVARGTVASLALQGYNTINLGSDSPMALNHVIPIIERFVGRDARIEYREMHPADPMITWADISRAQKLLGWSPAVDIEEGIHRTTDWYMAHCDWAGTLR